MNMENFGKATGLVWGVEEDRLLTVGIVTVEGRILDEFHIHIDEDQEIAIERLRTFLRRWAVSQLYVEDLLGLQDVKSRLDGPLSIKSAAWKRKLKACLRFRPRLQQLGLKIIILSPSVQDYSRCCICGETLTRDFDSANEFEKFGCGTDDDGRKLHRKGKQNHVSGRSGLCGMR
jgi:hypothetical protein